MTKKLSASDLKKLNSKKGLLALLSKEPLSIERGLRYVNYQKKIKKTANRADKDANLGNSK